MIYTFVLILFILLYFCKKPQNILIHELKNICIYKNKVEKLFTYLYRKKNNSITIILLKPSNSYLKYFIILWKIKEIFQIKKDIRQYTSKFFKMKDIVKKKKYNNIKKWQIL